MMMKLFGLRTVTATACVRRTGAAAREPLLASFKLPWRAHFACGAHAAQRSMLTAVPSCPSGPWSAHKLSVFITVASAPPALLTLSPVTHGWLLVIDKYHRDNAQNAYK
jgi:hypothetical protein